MIFFNYFWITSQSYQQRSFFIKITTIVIKFVYFSNFAFNFGRFL